MAHDYLSPAAAGAPATAASRARPERRFTDIDRAKGLAIFLVVLGHIVAREPPAGNEWYVDLKAAIYQFHMPFFMYLSGFVFFHTRPLFTRAAEYFRFTGKRAVRLLLPFLLFGFAIIAGKLIFSHFIYVDNLPEDAGSAIGAIFWDTSNSPATSVWYIYVLFVYCTITPILLWLLRGRLWPLLALGFVLFFLPAPPIAYADRVATYFVFFVAGGIALQHRDSYLGALDSYIVAFLACFALSFVIWRLGWMPVEPILVIGLCSLPALHALVRTRWLENAEILYWLGAYTFVIYLLNTIFIGLAKGVILEFATWDGQNFLVIAPILLLSGLLGPVLIKKYVFGRIKPLDRITD